MTSRWIGIVMLAFVCVSFAQGQTSEKVIFSFNGADGNVPSAGLVADKQGNLYGTTFDGGFGLGNVFELSPAKDGSWTETVLHNFTGPDGAAPVNSLILDDAGNLYGTAQIGGQGRCTNTGLGCGVVFELSPNQNGWTYTVLYNFLPQKTKGVIPVGGLVFDKAGNLYGTTWAPGMFPVPFHPAPNNFWGCDNPGCGGTVYKLTHTSAGWEETDLYAFTGGSDGSSSQANLIFDSAGNLYGTTVYGGITGCISEYGCGVVFKLTPGETGWKQTVLYRFTGGTDGAYPLSSLVFDAGGNLYSTASVGGNVNDCSPNNAGCGTVFELTPAKGNWTQTVLYTFTGGTDGALPYAAVIFDSHGSLYGTTEMGGDPAHSLGVVFKLAPSGSGWTEEVLHTFLDGNGDGQNPAAPLIFGPGGLLYGTTLGGGSFATHGTVFAMTP